MLVAGRIGDICGHKACFVGAWIWLAISSVMTGVSKYSGSYVFYCLCRGLQGLAGAMLVPSALALLGSIYREGPRKNLVFSLYAAGSPWGATLGGVFGALFTQLASWPWAYYLTAIVACGEALLSIIAIPDLPKGPKDTRSHWKQWREDFDWVGSFTGVGGLLFFNVAWNQAPSVGWGDAETIVTLVLGSVLLVAFLFVERAVKLPLIPIDKLSATAAFILATMALAWASFGVLIYYLVNFTIQLRGDSLLSTAAQFSPILITGVLASYLNTFLLRLGVPPTDTLSLSLIWFTVGNILLATMPVHQTYWEQAFWIYILAPFGMDLSFPSGTLIMSNLVPAERQGIAASLIATVVYYSQSIGLGIAGTVETNVANGSVLRGYRGAMYTGIGLAGAGFVVSLWPVIDLRLKRRRGRKIKESPHSPE